MDSKFVKDLSASFQKTISDIIIKKIEIGINILLKNNISIKSISVVGGVANNKYIKDKLEYLINKKMIKIYYPIKEMMSDNAAMIAWACLKKFNKKKDNIYFKPDPRLKIKEII